MSLILRRAAFPIALGALFVAPPAYSSDEPDNLILPPGFHATVVVDGVPGARHLAFRANGDLFVSTRGENTTGVVAIHLDQNHRAERVERFTTLGGGTGIRFRGDDLFVSSPGDIYRFHFERDAFVPSTDPETIVQGMPQKGFTARPLALDDEGYIYVGVGGSSNICVPSDVPKDSKPIGMSPCPDLGKRAGVWRFKARRTNQSFPGDGAQYATGLRDVGAMDWRSTGGLYLVMHNRNGTSGTWPEFVSASDEVAIAEEMHHLSPITDLGWPYTYYDAVRQERLLAPEYGGDGKKKAAEAKYSVPIASFVGHSAPLDPVFYRGEQFPKSYRGGAFVVLHGGLGRDTPEGHNGYEVQFLSFGSRGPVAKPVTFAAGFAGPGAADKNASKAKYRPVGAAVGPDGALYVADSNVGRIWRIAYSRSDH